MATGDVLLCKLRSIPNRIVKHYVCVRARVGILCAFWRRGIVRVPLLLLLLILLLLLQLQPGECRHGVDEN